MPQPTITKIGNRTSVDWNDYNLTCLAAATLLATGKNIIAKPYPDYSSELIEEVDPDPETLEAKNYEGKTVKEIFDDIRYYEKFAILNPAQ